MPHNFKLTGDYYVSKYGSDSNNGTSPDTPKRTVQAGLSLATSGTRYIIIGSGVYKESLSSSGVSSIPILIGDGDVTLDGGSSSYYSVFFNKGLNAGGVEFRNIKVANYVSFYASIQSNNYSIGFTFQNCILENCDSINLFSGSYGTGFFIINTKIINCKSVSTGTVSQTTFSGNIVINSNIYITSTVSHSVSNSYFNSSSTITSVLNASHNYNNIQGIIIMNVASTVTTGTYQNVYGRYYNLAITTSTGSGTVGDPYGRPYTSGAAFSFATHRILYPTYNVNSISADPLFNNIQKRDFTLQATSPHLYRASDGISNIGGTQLATRVASTSASLSGGSVSVSSLNLSGSDYVVTSPATSGFVVSAPILVNATAKVLKFINYNGLLAFNKDSAGATTTNLNVPDALTFTAASAQAGANPDRLTYYMRWSTGASQPAVDADWDNGSMVTAGNYSLFEWNTKPSLDYSARGNGEQNFDTGATPTYIKATYIQLKVVLRNDYLI